MQGTEMKELIPMEAIPLRPCPLVHPPATLAPNIRANPPTSAAGNDVICGNDLSATSVTFTTSGEHMGVLVRVESINVGTTLKWLMTLPNVPFGTEVGSVMSFAIAT